jgi:hypothetical protein
LRDGQRASADKPHTQVARDLGRKLHVFSTEDTELEGACENYLQVEFVAPFRMNKVRVVQFHTVTPIGQQS